MYIYILTRKSGNTKQKQIQMTKTTTLKVRHVLWAGFCMPEQSKCMNSCYCVCFALLNNAAVDADADAGCRLWQR